VVSMFECDACDDTENHWHCLKCGEVCLPVFKSSDYRPITEYACPNGH
jgi:hypothetical protein